jgi:transcriptional regulator with XRE-family HTH domain
MEKRSMAKAAQEGDFPPELQQLLTSIGERIKELRVQRGLTQKDLAEECDLKQPYVFELERGAANLTMKTLLRVSNAFGVTPRDLLPTASPLEGEHRLLLDTVTRVLGSLQKLVDDETKAIGSVVDNATASRKQSR